jgi:hypothetical protein
MEVRRKTTRDIHHVSETALDAYTGFSDTILNDVPDMDFLRQRVATIAQRIVRKLLAGHGDDDKPRS